MGSKRSCGGDRYPVVLSDIHLYHTISHARSQCAQRRTLKCNTHTAVPCPTRPHTACLCSSVFPVLQYIRHFRLCFCKLSKRFVFKTFILPFENSAILPAQKNDNCKTSMNLVFVREVTTSDNWQTWQLAYLMLNMLTVFNVHLTAVNAIPTILQYSPTCWKYKSQ